MQQLTHKNPWKTVFIIVAFAFLTTVLGIAGWFYRYSRLHEVPPPSARATRPVARIMVAPLAAMAPDTGTPGKSPSFPEPSLPEQIPAREMFEISLDPMQEFQEDLRKTLRRDLVPAFPELPKFLGDPLAQSPDPARERFVFQLIDAVETAPADQRPAILLAADLVADEIWCPSENKQQCDQLRSQFAQHRLRLEYVELGEGFFYQRDLLWRVWQQYPETDWGERAFVVLLGLGWDTSRTCAKGSEQFREMIRQGESFLQQQPTSPERAEVSFLTGQAYATWWSLGNEPADSPMADYVDPKRYNEGAEQARLKAISYFEKVVQLAPETKFAEYAHQILPALRNQQIQNTYKFFCVYD
jgi:hypothetical protein